MTKKEDVLEILKKEELTSIEISDKTGYPKNIVWVYLNQLFNEKKIVVVRKEGRSNIYKAVVKEDPLVFLKFLNDFFKENIEYLMENNKIDKFIERNEEKFNKIEEVIVNAKYK